MKHSRLYCVLLLIIAEALAHRLDDCLQAARVAVAADRIDLFIDLTPGGAVADRFLSVIDQDRDGQISKAEGVAYAQALLKDVRVALDRRGLIMSVVDVFFPTLQDIRYGLGVIRIKATAPIGRLAVGSHVLTLSNAHQPAISVYLVNALRPKDAAIEITKQIRDELQQHYRLEFLVSSSLR